MKLEEAITANIALRKAPVLKDNKKVVEALTLGIEALKREQTWRSKCPKLPITPLPCETQD